MRYKSEKVIPEGSQPSPFIEVRVLIDGGDESVRIYREEIDFNDERERAVNGLMLGFNKCSETMFVGKVIKLTI